MSLRRPAAGRRVGAGMLRVDAVRAISKLRDYQLSEPTAWVLEAIRAAVASGASSIDLQGDSNDVWLSWKGEPWPGETLPALLDELVSPASAREGQKLRLLGTAVNSALGLRPSYVDVFRIANGEAEKVRYLPTLLEEQEGDASLLERPSLERAAPPKRAGDASMFIHFRRRFGLEPIRNLIQGQPPEMLLARAACVDLPVPIVIGKDEIGAHRNESDLLRIDIGQDIDGFLALMKPSHSHASGHAMMHVAEQGVHIASYAHDLDSGSMRISPPVRFYINAERMPTNASRSEVRRNSHPISTAERQIPELFRLLCEAIVAELEEGANTEHGRREQLRESVLALIGALIAGRGWSERARSLRPPFHLLARLKLLRNALGEPRAPGADWDENMLYTDREPLALDMAPWFHSVLWLPSGDSASVLSPGHVEPSWLKIRLRDARRELKARRRFEAHEKREARFDRVPKYWVRAKLDASLPGSSASWNQEHFDGEVYLWPKGRSGSITVLIDGREIEEVELDLCPLPFRAVVAAPDLSPASDFKAVVRDASYKRVAAYVLCSAIRCVEALCLDGADHFSMMSATSPMKLRALVIGALETLCKLGHPVETESVLARHPAWELTDGRWASLSELRAEAAVGCVANRMHSTAAASGRSTVILRLDKRKYLRSLLEPETPLVFYDPHKLGLYGMAAMTLARGFTYGPGHVAALAVEDDDCRGAIAWGMTSNELRICHRMKRLASLPTSVTVIGATIAVDSDRVIPNAAWRGMLDDAGLRARDYSPWLEQLVRAYALALIGRPPETLVSNTKFSLLGHPGKCFMAAVLDAEDVSALLDETYEALRAAPLFDIMGGERVSADDLAAAFPSVIDYLESAPRGASADEAWKPLLATRSVATFVGRLVGRDINHALGQLQRREEMRLRRAQIAAHRMKPTKSIQSLVERCSTVVDFKNHAAKGLVGMGEGPGQILLYLLLEERVLMLSTESSSLNIVAALEVDPSTITADLKSVRPDVLGRLKREILACAPRLIEAKLKEESTALGTDWVFRAFLDNWLRSEGTRSTDIGKIRDLVCFYDQRGEVIALKDVLQGAYLRVSSYDAGTWTEASEGAERDRLDEPIVAVSEDAIVPLMPILQYLCDEILIVDDTDEIRKLQIARRIERGLLLSPRVPVVATLKRSLTDLVGSECVGEIGFYDGPSSHVRICEQGTEKAREEQDLLPVVVVAIEDSTLLVEAKKFKIFTEINAFRTALRQRVKPLATLLLESVLASKVDLPDWLRLQLVRALCLGYLDVNDVEGLASRAIFRSTRGEWVTWQDLVEQAGRFGSVWCVPVGETREPFDARRIAIMLPSNDLEHATNSLPFVEGRVELSLDAVARENRERPPVLELALSAAESAAALTTIDLGESHGVGGVVAPLLPAMAKARNVRTHIERKLLGDVADPCIWPTLTLLDDPQLSPNRSWSGPLIDKRWAIVSEIIAKASDHALKKFMPPPEGTLTSHWVGRGVETRNPRYHVSGTASVRGRLWLFEGTEPGVITVRWAGGESSHNPRANLRGMNFPLPVFGELLLYSQSLPRIDDVVSEVVELVYPSLLLQVAALKKGDADHKAAHLAIGLATGDAKVKNLLKTRFECFSPAPLSASEVVHLLQSDSAVAMLDEHDDVQPPKGIAFLRNDSQVSHAFERLLSGRLIDLQVPGGDSFDVDVSDWSSGSPNLMTRAEAHVLDALADDLHRRLVQLDLHTVFGYIRIDSDRAAPLMEYDEGELLLAGKNKTLLDLQTRRISGNTTHEGCLDLLVAHAITILNQALTSVTDATEHRALVTLMLLER